MNAFDITVKMPLVFMYMHYASMCVCVCARQLSSQRTAINIRASTLSSALATQSRDSKN